MTTGQSLPELPPYHLQHLVSNVKELLGGSSPGEAAQSTLCLTSRSIYFALGRPSSRADRGPVEVRCAQALGKSSMFITMLYA
jgi:hypothetical protein